MSHLVRPKMPVLTNYNGFAMLRGFWRASLLTVCFALPCAANDVPYCHFPIDIDGDLREWRRPWLDGAIVEVNGSAVQRNTVAIRICWDLDGLRFGMAVQDADRVSAPALLDVDRFHQYDSLQIYLDARADATARMNDDDLNLLLLPDGRFGLLRGDALIGVLTGATVPQRVGAPLRIEYGARTHAAGWQSEVRIPFAGLGLQPSAGMPLGVDVTANDWLVDHPLGNSEALTPDRIKQLANRDVTAPTPDAVVGTQLLPRSWTGATDFGYPNRWRALRLAGGPSTLERLVRLRGSWAVAWIGIGCLGLGLIGSLAVHLWHRRRLRALLQRLPVVAEIGLVPTTPVQPVEPAAPDAEPRDREFADRVLAYVNSHLQLPLAPADLAAQFHVSLRTLQRRLKAGLDTSPQDLVLAARLSAAQALLREGRWRISEVASQVGFEDPSHFSRRYRQAFGHAPSDEH